MLYFHEQQTPNTASNFTVASPANVCFYTYHLGRLDSFANS